MNIRRSITCMVLMISTGYSSLMSVGEFEDNLNNAINNPTYTFKGMRSQEPGLNESREYYRVVEGFVGHWFERDKELLSLAIAAGKFGDNTEFMWTLYNMASMGALMVEGRDNLNKSFYQDVESEESVDSNDGKILTDRILEEEPAEEVTNEKVKILNLDINSFKEGDKATARSIDKKIEEFLKNSEDNSKLFSSQLEKFSIPELILISSNDYYERYRDAFVESNRYKYQRSIKYKIKELDADSFKTTLHLRLKNDVLEKMSEEELSDVEKKCHEALRKDQDILKAIFTRRSCLPFIPKSIKDDKDKKTATSIANKIIEFQKNLNKNLFISQLAFFSIPELILISSRKYYESYEKVFVMFNLYKVGEQKLDENIFKAKIISRLKYDINKMNEEELNDFNEKLYEKLKSDDISKEINKRKQCLLLMENIAKFLKDEKTAQSIAKKIEEFFKNNEDNKGSFSSQLREFFIHELILISSKEYYEKCRDAFIGSNLYKEDGENLDENIFKKALISKLYYNIEKMSQKNLSDFDETLREELKSDDISKEINKRKQCLLLMENIAKFLEDKKAIKNICGKIEKFFQDDVDSKGSFSLQLNKFSIHELILISSSKYYEKCRDEFIQSNLYEENGKNLDKNTFNERFIFNLCHIIEGMNGKDLIDFDQNCSKELKDDPKITKAIVGRNSYLSLTVGIPDSIKDEGDKKAAKHIASRINYRDFKIEKFSIPELILISSREYYDRYEKSFLTPLKDEGLKNDAFKNKLLSILKNNISDGKMVIKDCAVLYNRLHAKLKADQTLVEKLYKRSSYYSLVEGIPEVIDDKKDKATAQSIAVKIKGLFNNNFSTQLASFSIHELILIASKKYYEEYRKAFVGSNLYQQSYTNQNVKYMEKLKINLFKDVLLFKLKSKILEDKIDQKQYEKLYNEFHKEVKDALQQVKL